MASEAILNEKKAVVSEIVDKIKNSESVIIFNYHGISVSDLSELRRKLRDVDSEIKVYKNTLLKLALDELKINLDEFMEGPNAILFGKSLLEPIKVISDYSKSVPKLEIRVGIISGDVANLATIKDYANIPSREGLLTMIAGGMMQYVRDLAIGLNLYVEKLNDGKPVATEEIAAPVEEAKVEEADAPVEEVEETVAETSETTTEEVQEATTEESSEVTEEVAENKEEN